MSTTTTIDQASEWKPKPFRPWWRFLFAAVVVIVATIGLALFLPGCTNDVADMEAAGAKVMIGVLAMAMILFLRWLP